MHIIEGLYVPTTMTDIIGTKQLNKGGFITTDIPNYQFMTSHFTQLVVTKLEKQIYEIIFIFNKKHKHPPILITEQKD